MRWIRRVFAGVFREVKEWWRENRVGVSKMLMVFVWIFGILMRVGVAVGVKMPTWNYDMGGPDGYGHMGYMWRIYRTGRLPEWNYQQFYHPPLHYLIGAGVLRVVANFTTDEEVMQNSLKIMPFCWSILILVVVWRLLGEIGVRRRTKYLIMTVFLCQTGLIRMACSVNNDPLSILLILYSLLWLVRWWKRPRIATAGVLGLVTGLAVMTKMSGVVLYLVEFLVFAIFLLFSGRRPLRPSSRGSGASVSASWPVTRPRNSRKHRNTKNSTEHLLEKDTSQRDEKLKNSRSCVVNSKLENKEKVLTRIDLIKMAAVFMVISLPIGLWYPARNYVKFGQDFTYVLDLGDPEKNVVEKPLAGPERGFQTEQEEELARAILWRIKNYENTRGHSVAERVVPPGLEQLVVGRKREDPSRDYYNLYASTILTSLYEDLGFSEDVSRGEVVISALSVIVMVWASVILAGVMTRASFRVLSGLRKGDLGLFVAVEMIMIIYGVVLIAGYVMTNLRLPMGCTTSFRYMMPLVVIGTSVAGMEERMSFSRRYRGVIYVGLVLMVIAYGLADLIIMKG